MQNSTLGKTIEIVGELLAAQMDDIQDLSEYTVILLWPVADSVRNQRLLQFSRARDGYKLDWDAFYRELSVDEKRTLPLSIYNRARLYFDMRIIPIRAADLHRLCSNLDDNNIELGKTYLERFGNTHFFHIISNNWENYTYSPVRETESKRADEASVWYKTVTSSPTKIGKRLAKIISTLGFDATYEKDVVSSFSTVRADVFLDKSEKIKRKTIIELKVFASENTMPSTIKEQIKVTLRRHSLFAGFMPKN